MDDVNKEERILKVGFQKSGAGSINSRVHLPITWIREMGISEEEREIKVIFVNNKIIIEKVKTD